MGGTSVTVSFGNFPANTAVNLYIGGFAGAASVQASNAQVYASGSSDRFGRGSLTFTMPSTWPDGSPIRPGKLVLLVATPGFGVSAGAEFDYLKPQPTVAPNPYARVNPSSGGAGTQVTVQGGGFPANTALNLFLGGVVTASSANAAPPSRQHGQRRQRQLLGLVYHARHLARRHADYQRQAGDPGRDGQLRRGDERDL